MGMRPETKALRMLHAANMRRNKLYRACKRGWPKVAAMYERAAKACKEADLDYFASAAMVEVRACKRRASPG